MTLKDLITRFVGRRSLAATTQEYYAILLGNFEWYTRSQGWPPPQEITRAHVRDFLDYVGTESHRWPGMRRCSHKKASLATVHHYGKVVKSLFNWAEEEEYLDANPTLRLKLGPPQYRAVKPYSDQEVAAMLGVCQEDAMYRYRYLGTRNEAIICLFVATGLRLEELSGIRLGALDLRAGQLEVRGKGGKGRVVPVNGEARKALRRYLDLREPGGDELWKTDDGGAMSMYSVKIMIVRTKRRAGINDGGGAHRFRHYFATRYLEAGGDLNSLRLFLGHSTLDMVLKYTEYVDARAVLARHEQFNPLDRLMGGRRALWRR